MNAYIKAATACPVGLRILSDKIEAHAAHDFSRMHALGIKEIFHLQNCAECGGHKPTLAESLWPDAKLAK